MDWPGCWYSFKYTAYSYQIIKCFWDCQLSLPVQILHLKKFHCSEINIFERRLLTSCMSFSSYIWESSGESVTKKPCAESCCSIYQCNIRIIFINELVLNELTQMQPSVRMTPESWHGFVPAVRSQVWVLNSLISKHSAYDTWKRNPWCNAVTYAKGQQNV